jgi:hypothetical protein
MMPAALPTEKAQSRLLTFLANAIVKNTPGHFTAKEIKHLSKNLGPKVHYQALEWIQNAVESVTKGRPVEVVLHPEWLRNRCDFDWTASPAYKIPTCLLVKIGDAKPRMVTLWPKEPYVVLDGFYPDNCDLLSFFSPQSFRFTNGKLSDINFSNTLQFSISDDLITYPEGWHSIETLQKILLTTCGEKVATDFKSRVQMLENSKTLDGCLLKKTRQVFKDWEFTVDWKKFWPVGPVISMCDHALCEIEFKARIPKARPFTVNDYARLVVDALIKGGQPLIDKDRASHQEIHRAIYDLYLIIGPEPYEGLPKLNRFLKEIGGEGYTLSINPMFPMEKQWTPSTFIYFNNPSLTLRGPGGVERNLSISPKSPEIIWDKYREDSFTLDLMVNDVFEDDNKGWNVLISHFTPTFTKEEYLQFFQEHKYYTEADNLKYIFEKVEKLISLKNSLSPGKYDKTAFDAFQYSKRSIISSWSCNFEIPDREVEGFNEYIEMWRSQMSAKAAGRKWVRVNKEYWRNRIFESLASGEIPSFKTWEFIGYRNNFAKKLFDEIHGDSDNLEEHLGRLNTIMKTYHPAAHFTCQKSQIKRNKGPTAHGLYLTLHLPDKQLSLEMRPFGNAFTERKTGHRRKVNN